MKKKLKEKKKGFTIGLESLAILLVILATLFLIVMIILILKGKLGGALNYIKDLFKFGK